MLNGLECTVIFHHGNGLCILGTPINTKRYLVINSSGSNSTPLRAIAKAQQQQQQQQQSPTTTTTTSQTPKPTPQMVKIINISQLNGGSGGGSGGVVTATTTIRSPLTRPIIMLNKQASQPQQQSILSTIPINTLATATTNVVATTPQANASQEEHKLEPVKEEEKTTTTTIDTVTIESSTTTSIQQDPIAIKTEN